MEIATPGKAAGLRISPEQRIIKADGKSLCFIVVEIVDDQGPLVTQYDRKAYAKVSGAGMLAAFGTGRPVTAENYAAGEFTSMQGRWLAIIRAGYEPGDITLVIEADGLANAEITIKAAEATEVSK